MILNKRWWTLKRTLPILILAAGFLFVVTNYYSSVKYVETALPSLDIGASADHIHVLLLELTIIAALLVLAAALLVWFLLNRIVTKPVVKLAATSHELLTGNYAVSAHLQQINELGEISLALDSLAVKAKSGEEISALNNRLIDIVEHSINEVYVVDPITFQILSANLAARERHGIQINDSNRFYPWSIMASVDTEDFKTRLQQLKQGDQAQQVFTVELQNENGQAYFGELTLQLLTSSPSPVLLMIAKDIQAYVQLSEDLQLRNKAMDALDVGITITDATREGHPLVYVNRGWCSLSGYDSKEMIGRPVRELQGVGRQQPEHALIDQAQSKGEPIHVRLISTHKDGTEFVDELFLSPVKNSSGELTHYIGVNRDITEQVETQRQLAASQRVESLGLLTGGIAHDFNNLLTVIRGNLEFLSPQLQDTEQKELLVEAENAAAMGARLTKRLLTFARRAPLENALLDVNTQVLEAAELLRSAVGERITLSTSLAVDLWPIHSDQSQLENAIINLVLNARDAIDHDGKIMIQTSNRTLDKRSTESDLPEGQFVCLEVSDNGSGMSLETQARVLEPFYTTKQQSEGTGLGLSTIYGFVKQSGGHLKIDSKLGQGTTVTLMFPRHSSNAEHELGQPESSEPSGQPSEKVFLVVENDDAVRKVTVNRLKALNYRSHEAKSSAAAIEFLSSVIKQGKTVDLVVADMANESNFSDSKIGIWLQKNMSQCAVLLTSTDANRRQTEINNLAYLQKPYSIEQLRGALDALLNRHHS